MELYSAGGSGNGSAPVQLLAVAQLTDGGGNFSVAAGSYSCPSSASVLYLVSAGGSVGGQASNSATELVTVLGSCGGVVSGSSYVVNELTTVTAAFALRPFWASGAQLGSTTTNTGGLALGVAGFGRLINVATGAMPGPGFPSNGSLPIAKLNTLGNALNGCITSPGSGSPLCAGLFMQSEAGGVEASDTFDAVLNIANQPGTNVSALYALASGSDAFSPALQSAPPDWTLGLPYTGGGMNGPTAVSIDSTGNVWVANYFGVASLFANSGTPLLASGISGYELHNSYGGAVDSTDRMWVANEQDGDSTVNDGMGSVTVLNASGPALPGNSAYAAGGLNFPISVAFDRNGTAWVVDNANSHVTVMNSAGVPQSGTDGYVSDQFAFPVAVAVDAGGAAWIANQSGSTVTRVAPDGSSFTSYTVGNAPSAVAVDAGGNVWAANYYGDSLGLVSAAGQVLSSGGFMGGGLDHPTGIAADGAGTAWVANYRAPGISALAGATAVMPGAPLSGSAGWGSDVELTEAFGIAVDAAGNVWVSSYGDNRLVEFVGAAAPVKTPLLGGVRVP